MDASKEAEPAGINAAVISINSDVSTTRQNTDQYGSKCSVTVDNEQQGTEVCEVSRKDSGIAVVEIGPGPKSCRTGSDFEELLDRNEFIWSRRFRIDSDSEGADRRQQERVQSPERDRKP
jgi:hypothetical protein